VANERQCATSSSPNDSVGLTQRAAEVSPEHPQENHTAPKAQLNLEEERQVAEAYKILQTFRLPTHDTTLDRCRHRGQHKLGLDDRQREDKGRGGGGSENCGGSDSEGGSGGDGEECGGSDSEREGSGEGREGSGSSSGRRGGSPGSDPKRLISGGEGASDGLVGGASEGENLDGEPHTPQPHGAKHPT